MSCFLGRKRISWITKIDLFWFSIRAPTEIENVTTCVSRSRLVFCFLRLIFFFYQRKKKRERNDRLQLACRRTLKAAHQWIERLDRSASSEKKCLKQGKKPSAADASSVDATPSVFLQDEPHDWDSLRYRAFVYVYCLTCTTCPTLSSHITAHRFCALQ